MIIYSIFDIHKANSIEMMNTLIYHNYNTRNVSEISKVDTITMEPYLDECKYAHQCKNEVEMNTLKNHK